MVYSQQQTTSLQYIGIKWGATMKISPTTWRFAAFLMAKGLKDLSNSKEFHLTKRQALQTC